MNYNWTCNNFGRWETFNFFIWMFAFKLDYYWGFLGISSAFHLWSCTEIQKFIKTLYLTYSRFEFLLIQTIVLCGEHYKNFKKIMLDLSRLNKINYHFEYIFGFLIQRDQLNMCEVNSYQSSQFKWNFLNIVLNARCWMRVS